MDISEKHDGVDTRYIFKAMIGLSFAALVLYGAAAPYLGLELTAAGQYVAAALGGGIGALLAIYS